MTITFQAGWEPAKLSIGGASYKLKPGDILEIPDEMIAALASEMVEDELPELPSADGTYSLQLVMDDGEGTLTWEAVEAADNTPSG